MNYKNIICGFHAINSRLKYYPDSIKEIYIDENRKDKRILSLINLINLNNLTINYINKEELYKISQKNNNQGIVCICDKLNSKVKNLDEILNQETNDLLLLILDGITDPHNLGACLRTASAAGVDAVIAPRNRSATINETVERVSCGASGLVPYIQVTNLARTMRELNERNISLIGTDSIANYSIYDIDATTSIAFVMGAEDKGMRRLSREICSKIVQIPIYSSIESLNVSVSSAICLYEAIRQRKFNNISN
ncbi:23S rRNA (guanosine-2'-O-)-methyltransferase RlmB [Candidatus Kinetoplastibacterium sorsogonicusi]|uniref:23S rRNA (Guanosine-2'-O-)-methyltransferase RlmB n=1 Tax=Candidatus Kinetoplastidibacterium kentomonadis TaxID=1576550 RepID=A0A3S7J9W3_9PROT|nr:23S rRNA (guanosine(2251)-2'-O)-methyltransferase RlmB [Candidatus Kinetoplastibacterium sorsogonicusi]AWD32460.1 23S rRNA (guanosine-2'-O-)-methyltransferase RlmB [Candidatus Kinetoplastibacterium sorsogonicusi]